MEQERMQELLCLSVEGAEYLAMTAERGAGDPEGEAILQNLWEIAGIFAAESDADGLRRLVYLYAKNVQASIDALRAHPALHERMVRMEIRPFILEMQRLWMLDADVFAAADSRRAYRERVMENVRALHEARSGDYKYDVSILLLAYNKLEYTKLAAKSILRYTDFSRGNIELILLNNGSDDGTQEYFERLPCIHKKIMNLRHNILGTYVYTHLLEGKYFVGFSNDVVATPHWLEHLLACMESDDRIGMAVPTCNEESISNEQGIPVPYPNTFAGMEAMQAFAAAHNRMNAALWEERSQLMPFLAMIRSDLQCLCAADPVYTGAEFIDDDLSTLLRRNGWRQLLLKDTFMHHFGGVTLSAGRMSTANNTLEDMRRVYNEKWGVDAWDSRGGFIGLENVYAWHDFQADERVLILEPRFGDLACHLLNTYRRSGFVPHMTAAVFDERYLPDAAYLFDEVLIAERAAEAAGQAAGAYNIISAGCYLDELTFGEVIADLERLYALLAPGGMLLLPVRNPGSAYDILNLTYHGAYGRCERSGQVHMVSRVSYEALFDALKQHPFLKNFRGRYMCFEEDEEKGRALMTLFHSATADLDSMRQRLAVRMLFLGIFKDPGEAFLHVKE